MLERSRIVFSLIMILALAALAGAQDRRPGQRGDRQGRMRPPDPIMQGLDADSDGALSASEIAAAAEVLLGMDSDGDGNLTREEFGSRSFGRAGGRRGGPPGGFGGMRGMSPVMEALDLDHDGELFEDEVTEAAVSLLTLDDDGNGALSRDELAPSFGGFRGGSPGGRRGGFGDGNERQGPTPRPEELDFEDGVATVPDRETFKALSYQGSEVMVDTHLAGLEFVKFQIEGAQTDDPRLYFMNTRTHRSHPGFMATIGIGGGRGGFGGPGGEGRMRGVLISWPMLQSPSGQPGLYTFEFEPNDAYSLQEIQYAHDLLAKHSDLLNGNLAYKLLPRALDRYEREQVEWVASGLPIFVEDDRYADVAFLPLHEAEGYGRLRLMSLDEQPGPRDVVIYPTLPNEMPRVAGIITAVRQTPLSHVNLRAVQDDVPNAFIAGATTNSAIRDLLDKYVYYRVADDGYELREASSTEYESHFADLRPNSTQVPPRDLSLKTIRPFEEIGFDDGASVGVKAANLAVLGSLGFRENLTPNGYAVPFAFYDAFMRHNGFYDLAEEMQRSSSFRRSAEARADALEQFQKAIKKGRMPDWMMTALAEVQNKFPRGTSIRCRSSTNNEDLPGFSGAGLYDSFTHHPDEGHLSKSIKQVYVSLWNFRAYEERSFYRIDHSMAAMGVVLHPNTSDERANGVAVTSDILYQSYDQLGVRYYVNAQVGEDLVTNPEPGSVPEELLLSPRNPRTDRVIHRSSLTSADAPVLSDEHLMELRRCLRVIDREFRQLYDVPADAEFAMEVEFKVTEAGDLFIKQARPWVF